MTIFFVTRHPGARLWAAEQGITVDAIVAHLDPAMLQPGDVVLGTLPVHLAAQVCARGSRYLHLSITIPADRRGTELSADDMRAFGARLEEYQVHAINQPKEAKQ